MDKETISSWIRNSSAFTGAPAEAITQLSAAFTEKRAAAGTWIIREGDDDAALYLLASGSATVFVSNAGEQRYLGNISTGQLFGEISPLSSGRRMASVTASEECLLLELNPDVLKGILRKYPLLEKSVMDSLERYLAP
ncbi:MAG: cyclic nucleotide-binding domain-containing protein [Verrucomicrobiaceae bacterium]|nr:cyclic nucleotide-binding domain-containing protein [Verrucomicrobiaceae bacterium]